MPRTASSLQGWLLIETEFTNSEPAIVLLRPEDGRYKQAAVYSGTAAPFNDTQVIHAFFLRAAADVPRQLVNCYEPEGPPFASQRN